MSSSESQKFVPKIIHFGPYQLNTVHPLSGFYAKFPLSKKQKCIVDNLWKHANTKALPDLLHILVGHLAFQNEKIQHLSTKAQSLSLKPKSVSFLEHEVHTLRVSLKGKEKISQVEEDIVQKAKKFLEDDKREKEKNFQQIPEILSPIKLEIYRFALANSIAEQLALQEHIRRICENPVQFYDGMVFMTFGYRDDDNPMRNFSFVSCCIDLSRWEDKVILGLDFSVRNLLQHGMVSKIVIPDRGYVSWRRMINQERQLSHICDHLAETDSIERGYIRLEIMAVPPSFNNRYPDDMRREVLIHVIPHSRARFFYDPVKMHLISETKTSLLDQIYNFRAMRSTHMASKSYGTSHVLVAESRNKKIFKFSINSYIYVPFQSFFTDDPELVEYYQKIQVKAKCFIHGSCSFNQRMRPLQKR